MLKRILGNTIWITLAQGIGKLAAFILLIFIARYLGDELYGKFSFATSLVGIMVVLANFGMGTLLIREVARKKELTKKYLENILVLKIFFSAITFGLIYLALIILQKDAITVQLTLLAGIFILINSFEILFYTVFRAWEKMKFEAISKMVYDFSLLGIGMLFIWQKFSAPTLMSAYIIAKEKLRQLYVVGSMQPILYWGGIFSTFSFIGLWSFPIFKLLSAYLSEMYYLFLGIHHVGISLKGFIRRAFIPLIGPLLFLVLSLHYLSLYLLPAEKSLSNVFIVLSITGLFIALSLLILYFTSNITRREFNKVARSIFFKQTTNSQ